MNVENNNQLQKIIDICDAELKIPGKDMYDSGWKSAIAWIKERCIALIKAEEINKQNKKA